MSFHNSLFEEDVGIETSYGLYFRHCCSYVYQISDISLPRINSPEEQPLLFQRQRHFLDVVEKPSDLERGEVGRDGEAAEVLHG